MDANKNAVNALLAEYEKAILELQNVIRTISDENLVFEADSQTDNPDCKSVQTILSHVVSSGYSYCIYIRNFRNDNSVRPEKMIRKSTCEYIIDLDTIMQFTRDTFDLITDSELERFSDSEKMKTSWKQVYDIEQMMEHAIVHILRHRRQIENFKVLLKPKQ